MHSVAHFPRVSGEAEPLEDWLAPLMARTRSYDFSALRWAGRIDFEVKANWKLVYENYMEGYHVFALHPRLLDFAPMETRWSGEWRGDTFVNGYRFLLVALFPPLRHGQGHTAVLLGFGRHATDDVRRLARIALQVEDHVPVDIRVE